MKIPKDGVDLFDQVRDLGLVAARMDLVFEDLVDAMWMGYKAYEEEGRGQEIDPDEWHDLPPDAA